METIKTAEISEAVDRSNFDLDIRALRNTAIEGAGEAYNGFYTSFRSGSLDYTSILDIDLAVKTLQDDYEVLIMDAMRATHPSEHDRIRMGFQELFRDYLRQIIRQ